MKARINQCDQIGIFLKVVGNKFTYKSNLNIFWLQGYCLNSIFLNKFCFGHLLGYFWEILTYFLFQHLVTLVSTQVVSCSVYEMAKQ